MRRNKRLIDGGQSPLGNGRSPLGDPLAAPLTAPNLPVEASPDYARCPIPSRARHVGVGRLAKVLEGVRNQTLGGLGPNARGTEFTIALHGIKLNLTRNPIEDSATWAMPKSPIAWAHADFRSGQCLLRNCLSRGSE